MVALMFVPNLEVAPGARRMARRNLTMRLLRSPLLFQLHFDRVRMYRHSKLMTP